MIGFTDRDPTNMIGFPDHDPTNQILQFRRGFGSDWISTKSPPVSRDIYYLRNF